jgi:thiol-disulfide isomerase/thioredoxin
MVNLLRWLVAASAVTALVYTMVPSLPSPAADLEALARGEDAAAACPANAKKANLKFTVTDMNGEKVTLASFKGKVIVLDFWATWCGPCKVEIPHFIEFQQKYGAKGLQVVGISVDDPVDKLTPYVKEMGMNYPVLQGLGHDDVQDAFGPILGIPVSVMISRDGKVCATHTGLTGKDVFEQEIQSLL